MKALRTRVTLVLALMSGLPFYVNAQIDIYVTQKATIEDYFAQTDDVLDTFVPVLRSLKTKFTLLNVPFARSLSLMGDDRPACTMYAAMNDQRLDKYLFSLPVTILLNVRLYQNNEIPAVSSQLVNGKGKVTSLKALFDANPKESLLFYRSATYGDQLDKELAKIRDHQQYQQVVTESSTSIPELLAGNVANFAILHPSQVYDFSTGKAILKYPFREYQIAGIPNFAMSHFMCNKTPAAQAFIHEINDVLKQFYQDASFLTLLLKQIPEKDLPEATQVIQQWINGDTRE